MTVMTSHTDIRFVLNGTLTSVREAAVHTTLLAWLRAQGLTATKEGCAEGDCGACTVLLGTPNNGLDYRPINACLVLLGQADGRAVLTAEGLPLDHPAPTLLASHHGTQCGFCSPGFTMSLAALARHPARDEATILDALSGNLCRCTGYRPIVAAARALPWLEQNGDEAALSETLRGLTGPLDYTSPGGQRFYAPETLSDGLAFLAGHPKAWIWSGGSDLGLAITKRLQQPEAILSLGRIESLRTIETNADGLQLGAAVSYAAAKAPLTRLAPAVGRLMARVAGEQIREIGTLGGNLGTASPIGDSLPMLLALKATIAVASLTGTRHIAMDDFITGYRTTALQPGELIVAIHIPHPSATTIIGCAKIAKRFDQDISTVSSCFAVTLEAGFVTAARLALGGVAAKPIRASKAEQALIGQPWTLATTQAVGQILAEEITPLDDVRGTALYRRTVAGNLLERLWREQAGEATLESLS